MNCVTLDRRGTKICCVIFLGLQVSNLVEMVSELKKTHRFRYAFIRCPSQELAQKWLIWQTPESVHKGAPCSEEIASSRRSSFTVILFVTGLSSILPIDPVPGNTLNSTVRLKPGVNVDL